MRRRPLYHGCLPRDNWWLWLDAIARVARSLQKIWALAGLTLAEFQTAFTVCVLLHSNHTGFAATSNDALEDKNLYWVKLSISAHHGIHLSMDMKPTLNQPFKHKACRVFTARNPKKVNSPVSTSMKNSCSQWLYRFSISHYLTVQYSHHRL